MCIDKNKRAVKYKHPDRHPSFVPEIAPEASRDDGVLDALDKRKDPLLCPDRSVHPYKLFPCDLVVDGPGILPPLPYVIAGQSIELTGGSCSTFGW